MRAALSPKWAELSHKELDLVFVNRRVNVKTADPVKRMEDDRPLLRSVSPFFIVEDLRSAVEFYCDKLGFQSVLEVPKEDPSGTAFLRAMSAVRQPGDRVRITVPGEFEPLTNSTWLRVDGLDRKQNSLLLTDGFGKNGLSLADSSGWNSRSGDAVRQGRVV